jgi:hypothetical protein
MTLPSNRPSMLAAVLNLARHTLEALYQLKKISGG